MTSPRARSKDVSNRPWRAVETPPRLPSRHAASADPAVLIKCEARYRLSAVFLCWIVDGICSVMHLPSQLTARLAHWLEMLPASRINFAYFETTNAGVLDCSFISSRNHDSIGSPWFFSISLAGV